MKSREFHKCIQSLYSAELKTRAFKRGKGPSTWFKDDPSGVGIELMVQLDRHGWNPQYGSGFMYHVTARFEGKPVYYFLGRQLTLHVLRQYDSNLLNRATEIFNQFSTKLPYIEGNESDQLYVRLKSHWTEDKVQKNINSWFCYYDEGDIRDWYYATHEAVIQAVDHLLLEYARKGIEGLKQQTLSSQVQKSSIAVDTETGEAKFEDTSSH